VSKKDLLQRQPAEMMFAEELERLREWDSSPVPPGWVLSPIAVEAFVLGRPELDVGPKIVVEAGVITRLVIGLLTDRGSLLVGEPGTAKSWISELVSAAISGDSSLTLQGGAISEVGQLLYSWNQAILAEKGPCIEALTPSPIYRGMRDGKIVRFEEVARCPQPLQDALLSILSDRIITIPALRGDNGVLYARTGFNVIATSNSVDEGVNRMSAALKRRMNFEIIAPIPDLDAEIEVVSREVDRLIRTSSIEVETDSNVFEILVTIFHELRNGLTIDGRSTDRLAGATLSTAEAIGVGHAMSVHAYYYNQGVLGLDQLVHFILGSALKDDTDDRRRLRHYFDTEVAKRTNPSWRQVWAQRELI